MEASGVSMKNFILNNDKENFPWNKVLSKIAGQCPRNFGHFLGSILPEVLEIHQWLVAVTCVCTIRQFMDMMVHVKLIQLLN